MAIAKNRFPLFGAMLLKRLALRLARKYPFAVFWHAQPDRAQKRGGGGTDRRPMQAALLRGGGGFDPDGGIDA